MPGVFSASVFRMEWSSKRLMHRLVCLFCTPHFKFAVSRMNRGGIEEMAIGHIFLTSSVWSVPLPPECQHWCLHIAFPLHHTFHPWSSKEAPENILRNITPIVISLRQNMLVDTKTSFHALLSIGQVWEQPNITALIWDAKLTEHMLWIQSMPNEVLSRAWKACLCIN